MQTGSNFNAPIPVYKCLSKAPTPSFSFGSPKISETLLLLGFSVPNTMSLLDKLWDDTLAGPQPDAGLGRLRKSSSLSLRPPSPREAAVAGGGSEEEEPRVTRSIMIKRPAGRPSPPSGTPPSSPAGSTPPISPFAGGGGGKEWNRFRRKYERRGGGERVGVEGESSFPPFEA